MLLSFLYGIPSDQASELARIIIRSASESIASAALNLEKLDRNEYQECRRQAAVEFATGRIAQLQSQTEVVARLTADALTRIAQFVVEYRKAVRHANRHIIPAYFTDQKRVPIDDIYIAPTFQTSVSARREASPLASVLSFDGSNFEVNLDQLLAQAYRVVVLGDPGAGKSTLTKRIAFDLTADADPGSTEKVPFIVTLHRYQEYSSQRRLSFVQYLRRVLTEDFHLAVEDDAIEYLLATGRATVIFDGLDELLDTHRRREVTSAIEGFSQRYPSSAVLVTSRVVGYREAPLDPEKFRTATLMAFSDSDVHAYARRWFALEDTLSPTDRVQVAESFIADSIDIADIRSNPLMLGLLCNIYKGARSIPRDRADLYEQCARMLFEKWDSSRGIRTRGTLKSAARLALQNVALWIFTSPDLSRGVGEKDLRNRISASWVPRRFESIDDALEDADELLSSWRGRAWVLTDVGTTLRGDRLYQFTHQTFLEYFAAVELVRINPSPAKLWKALGPRISVGEWDIVAQLAVQIIDERYPDGKEKIFRSLTDAAGSKSSNPYHVRMNLAAFAARYMDVLLPSPAATRRIVNVTVDLAIEAQAMLATPRSALGWPEEVEVQGDEADLDELDDTMAALLTVLAVDDSRNTVRDQLVKRCWELVKSPLPKIAANAFVLLGNLSEVSLLLSSYWGAEEDEELLRAEAAAMKDARMRALVSQRLSQWAPFTTKVGLTAIRHGLISYSQFAAVTPIAVSFTQEANIYHDDLRDITRPAVALRLLSNFLWDAQSNSDDYADALEAIEIFSGQIEGLKPPFIQVHTIDELVFERRIVNPYYKRARDAESILQLEDQARRTAVSLSEDIALGAAVLLGAVVELEGWDLLDESEDQIAFLDLGRMQSLETLFVARLERGMYFAMRECLARVGMTGWRRQLLESWSERKVDFTYANVRLQEAPRAARRAQREAEEDVDLDVVVSELVSERTRLSGA
ncbi:NACHT domain-containing protein [Micromonospora chalcea]|uniref:NACHT domain-containing protein n=1 Tax=Micromonospora chalcea TaxID=1874 RepID=UPI0033FCEC2C